MAWRFWDAPARQIFAGHLLLVVCCGFYLAWWCRAFCPGAAVPRVGGLSGVLLGAAAAAGLGGLGVLLAGIRRIAHGPGLLPGGAVLWGGAAAYALLLAFTLLVLGRPVTTELALIVGWAVLELTALNVLYGASRLSAGCAAGLMVLTAAAFAASMVCYVLYYRLSAQAGFVSGILPLVTEAVCMAASAAAMLLA